MKIAGGTQRFRLSRIVVMLSTKNTFFSDSVWSIEEVILDFLVARNKEIYIGFLQITVY